MIFKPIMCPSLASSIASNPIPFFNLALNATNIKLDNSIFEKGELSPIIVKPELSTKCGHYIDVRLTPPSLRTFHNDPWTIGFWSYFTERIVIDEN